MCTIVYYNNPRREAEEKATRERHGRCIQAVTSHRTPFKRWSFDTRVHGQAIRPRSRSATEHSSWSGAIQVCRRAVLACNNASLKTAMECALADV